MNFLSNSLKFTLPSGKITLTVSLEPADINNKGNDQQINLIRVDVTDNGVGVSSQNIKKIFEVFNKSTSKENS